MRSLFMEKEKELAIAVAKVESLTQQVDKQRKGWSQSSPSREKTHQELELERLRKELMVRMRDNTLSQFVTLILRDSKLNVCLIFVIITGILTQSYILTKTQGNGKSNKILDVFIYLLFFRRGMSLTTNRAFKSNHKNNSSLKNTKNCSILMLKSTNTPTTCGKNDHRTTMSAHQTLA